MPTQARPMLPALLPVLMLALSAAGCATAPADPPAPAFVPAYEANFPDPFILPHKGRYLAYATNAERLQANVQMAESADLVRWSPLRRDGKLHDAMPDLPRWAQPGWTWAPEVLKRGDHYLMYFTARERSSQRQCTGVAHADDPLGPFLSSADQPLICQRALGGTIDAHPFEDSDGRLYLYFKPDANAVGEPTEIMVQRLTPDGLQLVGEQVALLRNDKPWEAHVIEAPTMVRHGGRYILFYSANHFGWEKHQRLSPYAIGHALCATPTGPCTKSPANPLLHSYNNRQAGCLSGPGHQAVFEADGRQYMVFHAHAALPGCRNAHAGRQMHVAPLVWQNGEPVLERGLRRPGPRAPDPITQPSQTPNGSVHATTP